MERSYESRIRQLRQSGILNLFQAEELNRLIDLDNAERIALEEIRKGKQAFNLEYKSGPLSTGSNSWRTNNVEIWAENPMSAAKKSVSLMISEERGYTMTDPATAKLDVFIGNQLEDHEAEWVDPYLLVQEENNLSVNYVPGGVEAVFTSKE